MRISKQKLKRIIKEELTLEESLAGESLPKVEMLTNALLSAWQSEMINLFHDSPDMFHGRSTSKQWASQVQKAKSLLGSRLNEQLILVEDMLHDGQFHGEF